MSPQTVVVDGSNIATEGRQMPSLMQLDEAVRAYREEHPGDEIIVVVDATFAHRIPEDERPLFEEAAAHNELVYPPAGAVGRGDAFLLRIAEKTGAIVLSNDSFQEFHGEHDWLFEKGRLIGGTPVPGVGWIFVDRTPVRGPKSREAVKEARRTRARVGSKEASLPMPVPKAPPPGPGRKTKAKAPAAGAPAEAIAVATEEAVTGDGPKKRRRRKRRGPAPAIDLPTLNEPLTFIEFIAEHKLGSVIEGEVESFTSHGAFVLAGDARCYVPLSAMGDPPPRSAREVLRKGDRREFVVQALDAARRGVELALPGYEHVAGAPTAETVEAEIGEAPEPVHRGAEPAAKRAKKAATKKKAPAPSKKAASKKAAAPEKVAPAEKPSKKKAAAPKKAAKKVASKKAPETPVTPAKKAASKQAQKATPVKKAATKAATAKKATVKKAAVKKSTSKKATAAKKSTPRVTATRSAAKKTAAKKATKSAKKA